ncbi:MAG: SLC13 family permease [Syntrophobacteraceae bacterium]|jgi:sodium-dependent dicarboxylate transporter 2/3/5|nr:SLC13 family permease [Syntrophobacteraceae bacterium]
MAEQVIAASGKAALDWKRTAFIVLGLALFFLFYFMNELPDAVDPAGKHFPLPSQGRMALGLFLMAAVWWIFEVMPIGATAIAIGLFQVIFHIRTSDQALKDFFDPSVWFIFGSVVMGLAFSHSGLTRRMAYKMLGVVGENTSFILLGTFIIVTGMTLLMAHTAVAAALFPLLMAIHSLYSDTDEPSRFGKGLFIGMAWTAGAGSIITYLGAARGVAAAGMFKKFTGGTEIGFFELSYYMAPLGLIMVLAIWLVVIVFFKPEKARIEGLRERVHVLSQQLGPMNKSEKLVLVMVAVVLGLFMMKSFSPIPFFKDMDRAAIMMVSTLGFFLLRVLRVEEMEGIPWNIILLFGGAMSIGYCLYDTKAAEWMAVSWVSWFQHAPWLLFVVAIAFFVLCLTNFIMNVAAIAITLPISLVIAGYLGVAPHVIFFASLATAGMPFNLLIGAAPNAIAYESRQFTAGEFFIAGWVPSIILMALLSVFCYFIWPFMGMPVLLK